MLKFTPKPFTSDDVFDSIFQKDEEFFENQQWTYNNTDFEFENFFKDVMSTQTTYNDDFLDSLFSPENQVVEPSSDSSDNNASFETNEMLCVDPANLSLNPQTFKTEFQNSDSLKKVLPLTIEKARPFNISSFEANKKSKSIIKSPKLHKTNVYSNPKCLTRKTPRKEVLHYRTPELTEKIEKFYNLLREKNVFDNAMKATKETMIKNQIKPISFSLVKDFILPALMPNNYTVKDFAKIQGKNGYHYLANPSYSSTWATPRWSNNSKNFYQPSVIRKVKNKNNKLSEAEGLCPYCPIHDFENPDDCFYSTSGALYQHHLCKSHGVYTSGLEMPVPAIGIKNDTLFACCTGCDAAIVVRLYGTTLRNCLKPYYRHCFDHHNVSKKMVKKA